MEENNFSDIIKDICRSVTGKQRRAEIEEELLGHLEDTYERNKLIGKSDEDAKNEAIAALGDLDVLRERLGALHSFSHAKAASSSINIFTVSWVIGCFSALFHVNPLVCFFAGILIILSLARLRTANKQLNAAFFINIMLFAMAAVYKCTAVHMLPEILLNIEKTVLILLHTAMYFFVFSGLKQLHTEFCPQKKTPHLAVTAVIVPILYSAIMIASTFDAVYAISIDGIPIIVILFAVAVLFHIALFAQLVVLKRHLWDADAEYGISPLRKTPLGLIGTTVAVCIICTAFFMYTAATKDSLKTELVIHDMQNSVQAQEIRKNMSALKMPESIIGDLPDSEIMHYKDAVSMKTQEESRDGFDYQIFNFYFSNSGYEQKIRSLLRIEPHNKANSSGYYRCGLYHHYSNFQSVLTASSDPEFFISIQQKTNGKTYIQEPITENLDDISSAVDAIHTACGFEFRPKENQTIYFAQNSVVLDDRPDAIMISHSYQFLRQTTPLFYRYNTLTEYAETHATDDYYDLFYGDEPFITYDSIYANGYIDE